MSYRNRGLGQAKIVPGQISFQTLPEGSSRLPDLQALVDAGLPIAPYIEHGSWITGAPDIMRYGRDPYRGIMGLGQGVLAEMACDQTQFARVARDRLTRALSAGAQAALLGAAAAGLLGALTKNPAVGVAGGAAIGYGAHALWTATHRP